MTKNKDADLLAEAYKNINAEPFISEENIDPNSIQNAIAHLVAFLAPPLLYKVYKYIKSLKEETKNTENGQNSLSPKTQNTQNQFVKPGRIENL